jgi:hypothetical protein
MKVLKEYSEPENDYAKRIHAVEDCMRENEVSIEFQGGIMFVNIKGREFRYNGPTFPRISDDEKLYISE